MKKYLSLLFLLISFFALGSTLKCFDCDTTVQGCDDPARNDLPVVQCLTVLPFDCFIIKYADASVYRGCVYRGCVQEFAVGSTLCDYIEETASCKICSTDLFRRSAHRKRKCPPGKITRNPFFNYLRWFRTKHCGMNMIQVAKEGAKCWCQLSDEQRKKFYKEACGAPPMRRRKSHSRRHRSRSRGKRRSRSRKRKRKGRSHGRSTCGGGGGRKRSRSRRKKSRRSRPRRSRSRKSSRTSCASACSRCK